ncbi:MAG: hypothetical protein MJE68_12375 [Proteobacteria bacterium]|nr:hypothetical protein [Pseudomonadota bacterium]
MKMKANKKMVQQQLCQETGNIVLLKDLSNIALAAKKGESRNDLDATVQVLMEKYGMRMNKIIINNYDNNVLLAQ